MDVMYGLTPFWSDSMRVWSALSLKGMIYEISQVFFLPQIDYIEFIVR